MIKGNRAKPGSADPRAGASSQRRADELIGPPSRDSTNITPLRTAPFADILFCRDGRAWNVVERLGGMSDKCEAGEYAVVIGGSVAGLLATRVLADTFEHV